MRNPVQPPRISSGARIPPEVPEPERDQPHHGLDDEQQQDGLHHKTAVQQFLDAAVARAEHADVEQAADADDDRADRRPPHPVDRQRVEAVLDPVQEEREEGGQRARGRRP